eukprot:ANDGO_03848.mRNA.1 Serine carboxypeptidase-like 49
MRSTGSGPFRSRLGSVDVETGYLKTERTASEIFYYFVRHPDPRAPVIYWMQGGPFCSSGLAAFVEGLVGILVTDAKTRNVSLVDNPYAWIHLANLVLLDQPIGTGFSVAVHPNDVPNDDFTVAEDLFSALKSFHLLYPDMRQRSTFIAGESYGGKWIPYFGSKIVNESSTYPIDFAGAMIGNGWTFPVLQTRVYAQQFLMLGLADFVEMQVMEDMIAKCELLVRNEQWVEAYTVCDNVLNYAVNVSGGIDEDNLSQFTDSSLFNAVTQFLNDPAIQKSFGVRGSINWQVCSPLPNLQNDEMKDASFLLPGILAETRMLFYNGNYDGNCGVAGTEYGLRSLQWPGHDDFNQQKKCYWKVDGSIAGYFRNARNLSQLVVLDSGHLVPHDQPSKAFDMVRRFISSQTFCDA